MIEKLCRLIKYTKICSFKNNPKIFSAILSISMLVFLSYLSICEITFVPMLKNLGLENLCSFFEFFRYLNS